MTEESMTRKKTSHVRILIMEAFTDANVGSCALVGNSYKILKSLYKDSEIRVMAQYPKAFMDLYGIPGTKDIFLYPAKQARIKQLFWLLKTGIWMLRNIILVLIIPTKIINSSGVRRFFTRIEPFIWSDIILSVGAERLNDKYYKNGPFSLYTLLIGKLLKKKVVIFPSTIGPFFFRWSIFFTGLILSMLDLIYVREAASLDILINQLKVPKKKALPSVDVAVLQETISKEEAYSLIGIQPVRPIVGISVLKWGYFKNRIETPYSNYQSYIREMAKTVDSLIKQKHVTVVFYPTNFRVHACEEDDLVAVHDILPLIENRDNVIIISKLPTPAQLQGMLACSEVNITTRMHACIFSTNTYTPTISINYLFKLKGYMASLGLSDFSIDIEEFSAEKVLDAFDRIWPDRDKWRHHLEVKIKERKNYLWATMEEMYDII